MNNTGRSFEFLTSIINNVVLGEDIIIRRNHKISNIYGIDREIDVYIETNNGNIAIECKDWKKAIDIDLIDGFYGKTSLIKDIHKTIFVSRGKYRSGAKKLAENLGIELYTLDDIDETLIKNWLDFDNALKMRVQRLVREIAVVVDFHGKLALLTGNINLLINDYEEISLIELINDTLSEKQEICQHLCIDMYEKGRGDFWHEHIFPILKGKIEISIKNEKYLVKELRCICDYNIEINKVKERNNKSYNDVINNATIAHTVNLTFEDVTNKKIHIIREISSNKEVVYVEETINYKKEYLPLNIDEYSLGSYLNS